MALPEDGVLSLIQPVRGVRGVVSASLGEISGSSFSSFLFGVLKCFSWQISEKEGSEKLMELMLEPDMEKNRGVERAETAIVLDMAPASGHQSASTRVEPRC